jgi:hypothetical protein
VLHLGVKILFVNAAAAAAAAAADPAHHTDKTTLTSKNCYHQEKVEGIPPYQSI